MTVLDRARVYRDEIPRIVRLAARVPRSDSVRRIFIHLDRMSEPDVFDEFGGRVVTFFNYFQPALVLVEDGALDAPAALRVGADIVLEHGFSPEALGASFMQLVDRRTIGKRAAEAIVAVKDEIEPARFGAAAPVLSAFVDHVAELLPRLDDLPPLRRSALDYVGLFSRDHARARAAKIRARLRPASWRRPV
jgi:hypothetical protein